MCTIIHKSYKASYKLAPNQSLQNDLYKKVLLHQKVHFNTWGLKTVFFLFMMEFQFAIKKGGSNCYADPQYQICTYIWKLQHFTQEFNLKNNSFISSIIQQHALKDAKMVISGQYFIWNCKSVCGFNWYDWI